MSKKITIIDYGMGNLYSVQNALKAIGAEPVVTSDAAVIAQAEKILLPGVGAFGDCMANLERSGLIPVIMDSLNSGKPFLGICLGMQLLFDESHEYGVHKGLGLIKGKIASIDEDLKKNGITGLKVPHIGWNSLQFEKDEPLFRYNKPGDYVYYVHSFYGTDCEESTIATSEYGVTITGAVRSGKVYGTQFHPEKSGEAGLKMLKAFMEV